MSVVSTVPAQKSTPPGRERLNGVQRRDRTVSWILLLLLWAVTTGVLALAAAAAVWIVS